MKNIFWTLSICFFSLLGKSQYFDESFRSFPNIDSSSNKTISFNFESLIFFKNNEYFSRYSEGYTLPGAYLLPKFIYYPGRNTTIEVGYNYLHYFGANKIQYHSPFISFTWKIIGDTYFTLGSFNSGFNHKLIEPVYSREYSYTKNTSNGARLLINKKHIFADVWLDWEQFIFANDTSQEIITGAIDIDFNFLQNDFIKFALSYQSIMHHRGGQVNASNDKVINMQNHAIGLSSNFFPKHKFIKGIYAAAYYTLAIDKKHYNQFHYTNGNGFFINTGINTNILNFNLSYWQSDSYFTAKGENLFINKPSILDPTNNSKQMLNSKISFYKNIQDDIRIEARFENYYILEEKQFEFSYGVSVLINPSFFMLKL
jgi:hypothetical protein